MSTKLAKSQNELSVTGKPSSQDLVLARMLDLSAQITRQEVQPGEVRFWQETFKTESPEMLEWAFREYLKTAHFFPKPGDIQELIDAKRNEAQVDLYDRENQLRKRWESHGCMSGWKYAEKGGVVRCPECEKFIKETDNLLTKLGAE
jgi:gamma-glutamyltranspeptidase